MKSKHLNEVEKKKKEREKEKEKGEKILKAAMERDEENEFDELLNYYCIMKMMKMKKLNMISNYCLTSYI